VTELRDKIKNALDESRMLVLGTQVLLGLHYRSAFELSFERLPAASQSLNMGALSLILIALALILAPGAYHRIVEEGRDSERLHRFATKVMDMALLPVALALGIDLYVVTEKLAGRAVGAMAGLVASLIALFFWYGLEALSRRKRETEPKEEHSMEGRDETLVSGGTKLRDKIDHVLTEVRVVLPGAQALLGFQFITMLMEGFEKLPTSSKYVHLLSLALIALSTILLISPAAYHRIVEQGEETERLHSFASRMVLAAMVPLALGIAGDLFVVIRKVTGSPAYAATAAILMLMFFYGLWFGFTFYRRGRNGRAKQWVAG
jgi:hypothetical protein